MSILKISIKNLIKETIKDDVPGLAAEMAFNFILALFPFAIFLISIFGLLGTDNVIEHIIRSLSAIIPSDITTLIKDVLQGIVQSSSRGILTLGFISALWVASNAAMVIMKGLNRALNADETRPFWYTRALSILVILLLALVIFLAMNSIIFGTTILNFLDRFFPIPKTIFTIVLLGRWPVIFFTIFIILLLIYSIMPNTKDKKRIRILSSIPGALFFCVFWLVASWLFSLYVENFGRYNEVYGTLGAVIILLIWLYYTSLIILIGGEINSQAYRLIRPKIVTVDSR